MDQALLEKVTAWRRHLHAHPELSHEERGTAAFVQQKLTELGIPFTGGIGGHGIVATLHRAGSDRSVGLRADMDALPIHETTDLPYASATPGVMHACGHDGHTVALLATGALLAQDDSWHGTVQLLFQPAEENGAGARAMIDDGLFERFPMERVFAFHNWPGLEAGTVAVHHGPVMAAGGRWSITLHGLAGHAAMPHLTRDPIVASAHLIVALQTIVARNVDPIDSVVLSIGSIHGGMAGNQIPASVTLVGTLRTYRPEVREMVMETMRRITAGVAETFGMRAELDLSPSGRATINTPMEEDLAVSAATAAGLAVRRDIRPSAAGDDFAFLLEQRPGAYVWVGNGHVAKEGELHNANYDFNDAILPAAAGWMSTVARLALAGDRSNKAP
ncbi:MAG TPA: amidohydrolase [Aliidongia sp.]|uniref:amidohydrolase n=1 Tax=Aliidongia sp. TaxID=1914230 RepID=UPI002DDCAF2C|nr:amidohydrolase [Aliidongia sp.]HEV2674719.1 amidohydrolase [Aliidongia sp.]